MASLVQLLARHGSILVLDAASTVAQAGLLAAGRPAHWEREEGEAGLALFAAAARLLPDPAALAGIGAYAFCEGPGSLLGARTAAMAVRTWLTVAPKPVYGYRSLAVAAAAAAPAHRGREFAVIADARRDTWHCQFVGADGALGPLRRLPPAELPAGERLMPEGFRFWSTPPAGTLSCPYDLAAIFAAVGEADLFTADDDADAFQHEAPAYRQWTPQVHRAPTA
jgi:tRNA threonylcarbamoyladenosine biosynthesis protein TsaB